MTIAYKAAPAPGVMYTLKHIWKRVERALMLVGYSRAAAELSRQGRVDLARKLMLQRDELKTQPL